MNIATEMATKMSAVKSHIWWTGRQLVGTVDGCGVTWVLQAIFEVFTGSYNSNSSGNDCGGFICDAGCRIRYSSGGLRRVSVFSLLSLLNRYYTRLPFNYLAFRLCANVCSRLALSAFLSPVPLFSPSFSFVL